MFQSSGPIAHIANRVTFRNVRGTEKFIKERDWWDKHGMIQRIV